MSRTSVVAKILNILGDQINPATEENQTNGDQVTKINTGGSEVTVQNPFPTNGDSLYSKDINETLSTSTGWVSTDATKTVFEAITSDLTEGARNTGGTSPKTLLFRFNRTQFASNLGFGCNKTGENFSNIKVTFLGSQDAVIFTIDESTDNTDRTSRVFSFENIPFNSMKVEFFTTDDVCITNINFQKAIVSTAELRAFSTVSEEVESIKSFKGSLNVHSSDVHFFALNKHFAVLDSASTTINSAAAQDDTSIAVADTTGFSVGDSLRIEEGVITESDDVQVTAVAAGAPGTLTLDRPLDFAYTTSATVEKVDVDLQAVAPVGTLASPVTALIAPPAGEVWHVLRILINMTHATGGDDSKFGNLTALTNGVVMRQVTNVVGKQNISNWKTNGDMKEDMYDVAYEDKAGSGAHSTSGRFTLKKNDFVVALDGDQGDQLQILVQDNISALSKYRVKAQGHIANK